MTPPPRRDIVDACEERIRSAAGEARSANETRIHGQQICAYVCVEPAGASAPKGRIY